MKRVLLFRQGSFSGINDAVAGGLAAALAPTEMIHVDIHRELKARRLLLAANLVAAGWEYGWDLLRRRRDLDDAFFSTRLLFDAVRRIALDAHRRYAPDCSLQTQSMFDCSAAGTPHFVYTDHTYRSCAEYPDYGRAIWAPVRRAWLIELESGVYRHAQRVFTMSSNVERTLVREYGLASDRVECVGAGTASDAMQDVLSRIPLTFERYRAKRILFVGREWARKGGPELLDAFRLVRPAHPDARLRIVGCRPPVNDDGVDVVGEADADEVRRHFAAASVFCLPSRTEPFGLVFLEAMAAGLPVVARSLGAAPDLVEPETGVLIPPAAGSSALAEALVQLLSDPGRCLQLGHRARSTLSARYSWRMACAAMARGMRAATDSERTAAAAW